MESFLSAIYVESHFKFPLILSVIASYTQLTVFDSIYLDICDSAVDTVTVRGSNPLRDNRLLISSVVQTDSTSHLFAGYLGSSPRVKRPERDVHHAPLSSAEVKNQ